MKDAREKMKNIFNEHLIKIVYKKYSLLYIYKKERRVGYKIR